MNEYCKKYHKIPPSINWKFNSVNQTYNITTYKKDLVQLMVLWRNGLVHNLANFCTHDDFPDIEARLRAHKLDFYNDHCHLEINDLIDRFKQKKIPTFKETTSMIKATIDYLYILDQNLIQNLNTEAYIDECICDYMENIRESNKKEYFMYKTDRRISFLYSVLQQNYSFESNNTNLRLKNEIAKLANKDNSYFN